MPNIVKKAMQQLPGVKKDKPTFMDGLKNWALSPGGMATIVMGLLIIAWVEYRHHKK